MANHKSAAKRAKQNPKRRERNRQAMSTMKTAISRVREAAASKSLENIDALFVQAQSVIAKTKRKGTIHSNNMARRIARLAAVVAKAKQGASAAASK